MSGERHCIILVYSTSRAMHAERLLLTHGVEVSLIPVPRQFSSDCGICLRVPSQDLERSLRILTEGAIEVEQVHDF